MSLHCCHVRPFSQDVKHNALPQNTESFISKTKGETKGQGRGRPFASGPRRSHPTGAPVPTRSIRQRRQPVGLRCQRHHGLSLDPRCCLAISAPSQLHLSSISAVLVLITFINHESSAVVGVSSRLVASISLSSSSSSSSSSPSLPT